MEVVKMDPTKTCVNAIFDEIGHRQCGKPIVIGFLVCAGCQKKLMEDGYTVPIDPDSKTQQEEVKTHHDN